MRELPVVGHQDQALAVRIEPSHVEQAFAAVRDEVTERLATLLVGHRRDDPPRLVGG
jgi:hypothetical protein